MSDMCPGCGHFLPPHCCLPDPILSLLDHCRSLQSHLLPPASHPQSRFHTQQCTPLLKILLWLLPHSEKAQLLSPTYKTHDLASFPFSQYPYSLLPYNSPSPSLHCTQSGLLAVLGTLPPQDLCTYCPSFLPGTVFLPMPQDSPLTLFKSQLKCHLSKAILDHHI